jgi:hypothetical protein
MIGLIDLLILILFLVFTVLALITRQPFVFGIAGMLSFIFGIDLAVQGTTDPSNSWAYGIIGFCLIFFGFFLLIITLNQSIEGPQK